MNTDKLVVLGRHFRTIADYDAACKDAAMMEQIKKRYDLSQTEDLQRLINDIRTEKYRFRTILGQDFLDELEEELLNKKNLNLEKQSNSKREGNRNSKGDVSKARNGFTAKEKPHKKINLEDYDSAMQDSILQEIKKRERIRKILSLSCALIALCCFAYLGVYAYQTKRLDDYARVQQNLKGSEHYVNVTPETTTIHFDGQKLIVPEILEEYKTLYSLNKKLIGWVKIEDTYIDYPVLQTNNNEYYIDHNFDQEQDKNGSIFLDKDCSILPRSTNLILYGHHMRSGRMFGQLVKYSSEDFYENHKKIQFDTIYEKGSYEVMFVFRSRIYEESEILFKYYQFINANSEMEFQSYMNEMSKMALYDTGVTAQYGDQLLTLSTCDYHTDDGRFVVVAKKMK